MENKIIFAGPVGAGKTTSIKAISDIEVVGTEARASDDVALRKMSTTVAMDYGILNLENGERVHLYGTPGQERFSFMWEILSEGALGIVILIDAARQHPLADLDFYLDAFSKPMSKSGHTAVIGVTRTEVKMESDLLDKMNKRLAERNMSYPVFEVDGRSRADVKQMLLAMLAFMDPTISARTRK